MRHMRRAAALVGLGLCALFLAALFFDAGKVEAQIRPPIKGTPPPVDMSGGKAAGLSSVKILEDSRVRQVINVGRDCIKDEVWGQAVEALQAILNDKKDYYVQVTENDATGKPTVPRWTSAKFEANNLIGSMKPQGLETYETAYGGKAKTDLDEAKKNGDALLLADVAQRYCHTRAGIEANEILATLYLQRGQVFTAALRFETLIRMSSEQVKLSDLTLFKAAIAFRRAGDKQNYEETWKRLEAKLQGKAGLKVGDDMVPMDKLQTVLNEIAVIEAPNVHDWISWRGDHKNTAQANGSPPLLDTALFRRKILRDSLEGAAEDDDQAAETRINAAIKSASDANLPVMPGFFPIATQGMMIYRSQRDIRAIALKDLTIQYKEGKFDFKPGQIIWKTMDMDRSLALLLDKNGTRPKTEQWLDNYNQVPGLSSLLYDNTLVGTLVTDHRHVYAINDLAVPPHPNVFHQQAAFNPQFGAGELKAKLVQNQLLAFDMFSGKLTWELNSNEGPEDPDFKNSHFLSLPIAVGGKLYVLNERTNLTQNVGGVNPFGRENTPFSGESELRLVCIDPNKVVDARPTIVEPIQVLGNVAQQNRFIQDMSRRVNAVQLAFGEGVLVCPTNAGEVFGIDVTTRSLVWSYPYRENAHQPVMIPGAFAQPQPFPVPKQPNIGNFGSSLLSKWKSSPPAIQDGKIVFTAPDADSVHCIGLRDGKPVWRKAQAKGDLFMAGIYEGRVVIVGESNVRILDLTTGEQIRVVPTGDLPSGQGVASKGIYYLPLKKGEILAVDIKKGEVRAHNRAAVAGAAPGNLVFYEGMVLTQTVNEVIAYPQLSVRLDSAKVDWTNDKQNMTKLTDYGELLLKDGQVHLAVENLLKVYNTNPADPLGKRVKDRLFEGLTDLLQLDFNKAAGDHLTIYKPLCAVPGNDTEEQNRKAKFYRLVGQGREAQGNLLEAFQMYKDFGTLPIHRDGVPSLEDPTQKIPINVWLRGRVSGMIAKAPLAQREPLEAKIAEEWKIVEAKKDLDAIRSFAGMFDTPFKVGREARVQLAETIMERNERASFLEAELSLHQVMGSDFRADPATGGRALAALAQLEEKKGTIDSMRLAAAYYRQLKRDFANAKVRGNKTGATLFDDLATDKRYLAFLEETTSAWGPVKLAARTIGAGQFPVGLAGFVMLPEGDQTPFAKMHRVMLDPSDTTNPKLRLRDTTTNQDRWVTNLGFVPMNQQIFFNLYQQANVNQAYHPDARFRFYHVKGHLIVCQVGVMVYCIDGDTGKKLWEMQTVENIPNNGLVSLQQVMNDSEGNPEFIYYDQRTNQRFRVTLGRVGTAQASYVAVLGHKGLNVVDPLRGTLMWKKSDVSVDSHVFGDDQYLFLAEGNQAGGFGAGRTIRANDGETLNVKDFSGVYQSRIRVMGRQILAGQQVGGNFTVRLYDIISGKDVWSKNFPVGSYVLSTEDSNITGVLEPKGNVTVLDVESGNVLLTSNVVKGRVTVEELKNLRQPVLLQDSERFYIALNKPIDAGKVGGGLLHNNFNNGTRCLPVNGWFVALHRQDGQRKVGDRDLAWKKGDLAWHSYMPVKNQMLIVDQFENSPIVLFTSRYNEILPNGGNRWVSVTESYSKITGKMIYDSGPQGINGFSPMFSGFQMDLKKRTINLIGFSGSVQHYIDDGKGPPALPGSGMLNPGDIRDGTSNTIVLPNINNPGFLPPNGLLPVPANNLPRLGGVRIIRAPQPVPLQVLPVEPEKK
ncbi:MAG: hypothetical protein EXR98_02710 [Gemmataceae bacterium]|nr:hypothetical protein [Gemmataceae bacterium]